MQILSRNKAVSVVVLTKIFLSIAQCSFAMEQESRVFSSFALPIFYDVAQFKEFNIQHMPRGIPVVMHLQLMHSLTEMSFYLKPAKMPDLPVVTLGVNGTRHERIHRTDCHYEAWLLGEVGLAPGFLGVCRGVVEGMIPVNASHVCQVKPTRQLLRPRASVRDGHSPISVHSVHIYHVKSDAKSLMKVSRDYKMMTKTGSAEVHHPTFWRRLSVLKSRKRRSLHTVRLDMSRPVLTKRGPFFLQVYFLMEATMVRRLNEANIDPATLLSTIITISNSWFRAFDLRILPAGLQLHRNQTKLNFAYSRQPYSVLYRYINRGGITTHADCYHVFVGDNWSVGDFSRRRSVCSGASCLSGTLSIEDASNVVDLAARFTAEMAKNLNAKDLGKLKFQERRCRCHGMECLLTKRAGESGTKLKYFTWSPCTIEKIIPLLDSGISHCMTWMKPVSNESNKFQFHTSLTGQHCGNGFVEGDEQCDCGGELLCSDDKCCNASTCKLTHSATCAIGKCCDTTTCKLKPARTVCREQKSQCDLPEFCTGKSQNCPDDVTKINGEACSENNFCYDGECGSSQGRCRIIFGKNSKLLPPIEVQFDIDRYPQAPVRQCESFLCTGPPQYYSDRLPGNCLITKSRKNDAFYGWGVSCSRPTDIVGQDKPQNGAACLKPGMMCVNTRCLPALNSTITTIRCNGNGWLNSLNHCHCRSGWSPPDCVNEGFGGSVDSGPANLNWREKNEDSLSSSSWPIVVAVVSLTIIALFVIIVVAMYVAGYWIAVKNFIVRRINKLLLRKKEVKKNEVKSGKNEVKSGKSEAKAGAKQKVPPPKTTKTTNPTKTAVLSNKKQKQQQQKQQQQQKRRLAPKKQN